MDAHQPLRILRNEAVPLSEEQLGISKAVRAFTGIDDGNARAVKPEKIRRCESARLGQPLFFEILLIDAVQELIEHHDNKRFAHQAYHSFRILRRPLSK